MEVISLPSSTKPKADSRSLAGADFTAPRTGLLLGLTLAHFSLDIYQGIVPALVPFVRDNLNLSYTMVGALVALYALTSSIFQPVFGVWCDRRKQPWLLPASIMVASAGVAAAGLGQSFSTVTVALAVSAVGVAMFHPEAVRTAYSLAGSRRVTGMSWFIVGGNLGFAVGPLIIATLVQRFSISGTQYLLIAGALGALFVLFLLPAVTRAESEELAAEKQRGGGEGQSDISALVRSLAVVFLRSSAQFGITTFAPVYLIDHLHGTPGQVSAILTVFLFVGTLTTLFVSPLADRLGRKPMLTFYMAVLGPVILAMPFANIAGLYVLMGLGGMCVMGTWTITLVMNQDYLPQNRSLASAVSMSIGSIGGMVASPLGMLADRWGLIPTLMGLSLLPALAAVLVLTLPAVRPVRAAA